MLFKIIFPLFFTFFISYSAIAQDYQELLSDYILFWRAGSLKEAGKEEEAAQIYRQVPLDSPIRKKAVEDLIGLYKKKRDWLIIVNLAKERLALERDTKSKSVWHKEAVEAGYFSKDPALAITNFTRLLEDFPESKEALEMLEKYNDFYASKGDESLKAGVYLKHKQFEKVLESKDLKLQAEAFCGLKDYNKAISILLYEISKDFITSKARQSNLEELKLRLGEVYLLTPEAAKGLSILEELVRNKPGTKTACLSLWKLLNYWKEKGDEEKTKTYCRKLREGYKQFSLFDKAVWIEGWMEMVKGNYAEAHRVWQVFDTILRNSREKMSALYLMGRFKKLAELYPDTYYGLHAQKKIEKNRNSFLFSVPLFPSVELGELGQDKDFDRARALLGLEKYEEITFELEALKEKRYNDINIRYNLSRGYGRIDKFSEAVYEAESLVDFLRETGKWPGFARLSEEKLLEINFPKFYREEVKKRAKEFKLDENLIYAVIREESRFNEKDVSSSGAIGLMQIMPSTGNWIIKKTGLKAAAKDIFSPEINIFLGSWYLRYLLDKFNGDTLLAVAAYNGGPGLIERWVEAGGISNRDIAIEMMPKEETKYYCQKVLFSYYMYGKVYKND